MNMGIDEKILRILFEPKHKYKGLSVRLLGIPDLGVYKKRTIYNSVHRLKTKGYVSMGRDGACITKQGRDYIEKRIKSLETFSANYKKDTPKTLIVMYDIPEGKRAEREWFRWHLKKFSFEMIQRSVWVGPFPLPRQFLEYVKKIHLEDSVKIMRLAKPYTEKSFHL